MVKNSAACVNIIIKIGVLVLSVSSLIITRIESQTTLHKKPARITNVNGAVNNMYAIVQTTIYRDVASKAPPQTASPAGTISLEEQRELRRMEMEQRGLVGIGGVGTGYGTSGLGGTYGLGSTYGSTYGLEYGLGLGTDITGTSLTGLEGLGLGTGQTTLGQTKSPEPAQTETAQEGKTIITRAQLDLVGPNKQSTMVLDVKLELPHPPVTVETYGAPQIIDKVGQFVGAMSGPNLKGQAAGFAISGIGILADYATHVAEEELTKLYENQQFRINLLEIIPTRYYTIDMQSNKIVPTPLFETEVANYNNAVSRHLKTLKLYQDKASWYAQWYKKLVAFDPSGKRQPQQWAQLRAYDAEEVQPALVKKNNAETELAKMYPPYRVAIMASPSAPGNTCRQFGRGPWEIYVIYYIGARQTNQIAVKYCVANPKDEQTLVVELMQNAIRQMDRKNKLQEFVPGGIRITGTKNATFARSTGFQVGDFGASRTGVLNWFTEMVTHEEGGDVAQLLVPFDIHKLRTGVAEKLKATKDARMQGVLNSMDRVIARARIAKQRQEQLLQQGVGIEDINPWTSETLPVTAAEKVGIGIEATTALTEAITGKELSPEARQRVDAARRAAESGTMLWQLSQEQAPQGQPSQVPQPQPGVPVSVPQPVQPAVQPAAPAAAQQSARAPLDVELESAVRQRQQRQAQTAATEAKVREENERIGRINAEIAAQEKLREKERLIEQQRKHIERLQNEARAREEEERKRALEQQQIQAKQIGIKEKAEQKRIVEKGKG